MPRFVYNADIHLLYPEPKGRELKPYEHIARCPRCGNNALEDFREARIYPPIACGEDGGSNGDEGCGYLFTLEEIRDTVTK